MRCPKCHYISFEQADRCRNCGYDLSLASAAAHEPPGPELPLNDRTEDPLPALDLALDLARQTHRTPPADAAAGAEDTAPPAPRTSSELPLFKGSAAPRRATNAATEPDEDAPLVRPSAVPRPPIAVRRATPDVHRLRSRYSVAEVPRLDLESAGDIEQFATEEQPSSEAANTAPIPAPPVRRVLAGLIDLLIVAGINIGVLYFTLKLCDLPLSLAGVLQIPAVPVIGFLLLLDGGYFVSFTAVVGQTIGKMATGLRVVHVDEAGGDENHPNFGFATLRTAAYGASILPVGLGFLPALVGKDRRALHDRLAETRVIFSGKLMV